MKHISPISKNSYNLRHNSGAEGISNLGPKLWDLVPSNLKR